MRRLLQFLMLISFSNVTIAQTTSIPDSKFEQELINLGYDTGVPDGIVLTANIDSVLVLDLNFLNINSLIGIEDFVSLESLSCTHNQLSSLNISQNTALLTLECNFNTLTSLDASQNTNLTNLSCFGNQLSSLDLTQNTNLIQLNCNSNQLVNLRTSNSFLTTIHCRSNNLSSLTVIQNTSLTFLDCSSNQLNCLNAKNGNNTNLSLFALNNPNLNCIEVDDATWATANWTIAGSNIDSASSFSNNCNNACSVVGINEHHSASLTIYPNPTTGQLILDTDFAISEVTILDLSGKIITTRKQHQKLVDLTDLPSGIYFIKVITKETTLTKRFIKR